MQNALRVWIPLCRRCVAEGRSLHIEKRRRFYSSQSREDEPEIFKVVCGSSGSIDVNLYNAPALRNPSSPLTIYLPPMGLHLHASHSSIPSYLFHPAASLAVINYRWNISSSHTSYPTPTPKLLSNHPSFATHPFPTPLHDVLHAYSYLLTSLLPSFSLSPPSRTHTSPTSPFSPRPRTFHAPTSTSKVIQRPILVYGSYLGGTLATSLALTESFASKNLPTRIAGLITKNGVYGWTDIATSAPPTDLEHQSEVEEEIWDSRKLHCLKERLFSSPGSAFDSFASPLLFFRTAGVAVPKTWPTSKDDELSSPSPTTDSTTPSNQNPLIDHLEESIFYPTSDPSLITDMDIDELETSGRRGEMDGGSLELEVSKKANLKFPPKDSGLKIPRSLFLYTPSESPSTGTTENERPLSSKKPARKQVRGRDTDIQLEEKAGEEVTPQTQAEEMVRLMRRSVLLHEFKERVLWDEDHDPSAAAEERVQVAPLPWFDEPEIDGEGRVVRKWIEEVLDL
ncbi:uncharacterized protein K444DRAFT_659752 [Hyaloscypha bicolor E]|uniref:Alpha/beta-hydrolase n=1 Tax=Hyaloscypha bicolor E TaxID=1095630 RepID=A0A2J6TRB0_9HELO|nr:uncharacterized protein K444DRAFT_659752 [Hyaloscypha bicolor E]PMD65549.1 hypothetical protein K444DRAFT_659752 [Hyaloscypha bicolor E]